MNALLRLLSTLIILGASPIALADSHYDSTRADVQMQLRELDHTRNLLLDILRDVTLGHERLEARLQWYQNHELKTGSNVWKLKPEQPVVDHFIEAWISRNEYVPAQMRALVVYLRMGPLSSRAEPMLKKAEANQLDLERLLIAAKKKDGTYNESTDLPEIRTLLSTVELVPVYNADASQYLADKELLDRFLELRTKLFNRPVELSRKILSIVNDEGSAWTPTQLRKILFFVPVKKYFWELVTIIEDRQGFPMNWLVNPASHDLARDVHDQLLELAKLHANRPVKLSTEIAAWVEKNESFLSNAELELAAHFTPIEKYARKIWNKIKYQRGGLIGFAGFEAFAQEVPSLSTQNFRRWISLASNDLLGTFVENPRGNPAMDSYFDLNGATALLRQANNQGGESGESWLCPFAPRFNSGDGGSFVYSYFDSEGHPIGFARRGLMNDTLYFYDLEATLIGVARRVSANPSTVWMYAGRFYVFSR